MADKNTLDLARGWAADIDADRETLSQDTIDAAVEVIHDLPDEWVDADKVRELLDKWAANPFPTSDEVAVLNDVEALLPAPPAPRTMDEIEWDDAEHRLAEATAVWTEGTTSKVVMLNKFGKKITVYQSAPHYSGLRELNPAILTPTGRKYRLEPSESVPKGGPIETEFDPAYTYRDEDGSTWTYYAANNMWICRDSRGWHVRADSVPPTRFGPYTRIEA